jgi:Leucine-rich repeat (LRR) protein
MSAHRVCPGHITRRILTILMLIALLGAWSPRPVVLAAQTQIPAAEYDALVALYNSTDGANWTNKWTLPTDTPCSLYGVSCTSGSPRYVSSLSLSRNQLSGTIPSELGDLTNLNGLFLVGNQLTGAIPPELGNLSNLMWLWLQSNQLSGPIPVELGNLSNLHLLYLCSNQLTGAIPPELGNMSALQDLYLDSNQLSGSIPPELGSLNRLQWLSLGSNQLTGGIPSELGGLSNLTSLRLDANELTGAIPSELGSLSSLQWVSLDGNQLTGAIPSWLGSMSGLRKLHLGQNQLSGEIPAELGNLSNLQYLYLATNQLTGAIPPELGNLSDLRDLDLAHNALTGPVPATLSGMTMLGVPLDTWHTPVVDFGYNRLWTDDPAVRAFLDAKDPDWVATQDITIGDVSPTESTTLSLSDTGGGTIGVALPAGAVAVTTTLVLAPLAEPDTRVTGLFFGGQSFLLSAYLGDVYQEGFTFEQPVTVTLTYTDDQVAGVQEDALRLYVREGPGWVDAATTCEPPSSYLREPADLPLERVRAVRSAQVWGSPAAGDAVSRIAERSW